MGMQYNSATQALTDKDKLPLQSDASGNLKVTVGAVGSSTVTEYTEDAAAAANPAGPMTIARRKDTLSTSEVSTDGDNIALNATSRGELAVAYIGIAYTDRSIANLSGASETLMAANASRRFLIVHNEGATSVSVNLAGGVAAAGVGGNITLTAGQQLKLDRSPPIGAITVIGTLNSDVTAYEG